MRANVLAVLLSLVAPCAPAAQNLLANGDFDTDLSSWDFPDATPTWATFDMDASAGSGSAYFANTQAAAGVRQMVLKQCVAITQTGAYIVGASAYTPTGQTSAGYLVGSYSVDLHHADCSGGWNTLGGFYMSSLGAWQSYATATPSNPALNVPSLNPDASIGVELSVEKSPTGGSFGGYFDGVYLIRDTLFLDGFD